MQLSTQGSRSNCILEADPLKHATSSVFACVKSQPSWPLNVSQPLWEQHRGLLHLAQCLFWVSLTSAKLRHSVFTQRTSLQRVQHKCFLLDLRFPHPEGMKISICLSHHMTKHLWLLSFQRVPQRDQITAHRPQSDIIRRVH